MTPARQAAPGPRGKRPRGGPPARGQPPKKRKTVSYGNRVRSLQRLLNKKEGLDPRHRRKEEAKLEELRQGAQAAKASQLERKLAQRYHKVRFFERVKLERRLKQAQAARRAAEADPAQALALEATVAGLQRDLQYVLHFPKGEKYIALLKDPEDPARLAQVQSERARLHGLVRQQRAQAAMLADADEGLGGGPLGGGDAQDAAALLAVEEEEEDDFFLPDTGSDREGEAEAGPAADQGQPGAPLAGQAGLPDAGPAALRKPPAEEAKPLPTAAARTQQEGPLSRRTEPQRKAARAPAQPPLQSTAHGGPDADAESLSEPEEAGTSSESEAEEPRPSRQAGDPLGALARLSRLLSAARQGGEQPGGASKAAQGTPQSRAAPIPAKELRGAAARPGAGQGPRRGPKEAVPRGAAAAPKAAKAGRPAGKGSAAGKGPSAAAARPKGPRPGAASQKPSQKPSQEPEGGKGEKREAEGQPRRTRAEGGRKRRKKG